MKQAKVNKSFLIIFFLFSTYFIFAQESRTSYRIRRVPVPLTTCQPSDVFYAISTKVFGFCTDVNTVGSLPFGSGTANRVALWNGTNSLSSDSGFTFSGTGATFTLKSSILNFGTTFLQEDAANVLALRNSTNPQRLNIGNTFIDLTHKEDLSFYFSSNIGHIGTTQTGGTARVLQIDYGGTSTSAISVPITSGNIAFGGNITTPAIILNGGTSLTTYTEGSCTLSLNFGGATTGITYTQQSCKYTQVGDLVHIDSQLVLSSKGSATGTATITGLPVAGANSAGRAQDFITAIYGATYAGYIIGQVASAATTTIGLYVINGGVLSTANDTNFSNTSTINLNFVYKTN